MEEAAHAPLSGALLALLLGFAAPASALAQDSSAPSPEKEAGLSSKPLPLQSPEARKPCALETEASLALSALSSEMPGAMASLSAKERAKAISSMLSSLGLGVELLESSSLQTEPPRHPLPEQGCLPGVSVSSNRIFYIRLNRLDKDSAASLKADAEGAFRMARRPLGLVLDLRDCDGSDPDDASAALAALELKDAAGLPVDLHMAVLVGARSSGSAELLASLAEHFRKGLVIGAPTAGRPFRAKLVKAGDFALSVPEIPDGFSYLRQAPLKPAIEASPYPQVDYSKLRSTLRSEESDQCLSRAIDLLVGLDSIKRKWKKTGN